MMTPEQAVFTSILLCVVGALLTLLVSRSKTVAGWLASGVTSITAILIFSASERVLVKAASREAVAFGPIRGLGITLRFHVDGLAAFFLMLAAFIAVLAAFYSIAYMRHYNDYGVARYYPNFLLFLGGLYGLLSTTDMMWTFFLFWQLMTLPSYALIRFEQKNRENVRAAYKYLLMMELACIAIMIGAAILAAPGQPPGVAKYDFETVSGNLPLLLIVRPGLTALAFAFFLAGFGILMGMWPFGQFWLPDAESACPAPASALFSGVMIKVGVYGLIRYLLGLVTVSAMATFPLGKWGMAVALVGTITLFTGTMQALKQEQSKRLLAFHSIGQIGYILLGIGACMALLTASRPAAMALAALALTGALFHVLNHGLFKGLLFLNAGSMLYATGTQDLNQMGGLMKFMPLTGLTALVASFSISGVPLFNGFASKWSIYVVTIQGGATARYLPLCAVIAILTSALTLASFIKFFGVSFLSRTSALVKQQSARKKLEVPWMMQIPQMVLAFFCVLLGVVPGIAFVLIRHALQESPGSVLATAAPIGGGLLASLQGPNPSALFMPLVLAAVLGLMFLLAYGIAKLGSAPRRAAAPWLCGYALEAECNRYVAHNFYGEIKRYFRWLGGLPHSHPGKPAMRKLT
ncbi:MAG TPA: proton-conducting transporter membrane subunit [Terriglobales bacterium]|nr:proton-conducting transporter membrane subunit [Terriglobales bacterium]